MLKGTVFYHRNFKFKDNKKGDKLLIVLNSPVISQSQPFLFCKTTSHPKYNISQEGCYSHKNIYYLMANSDFFRENTWIQFHEIYEYNSRQLLQKKVTGDIEVLGELKESTTNVLVKCIKQSEDVSDYYLKLL